MNSVNRIVRWFIIFVVGLSLVGCGATSDKTVSKQPPKPAKLVESERLEKSLLSKGVVVFSVGENKRIMISSKQLFNPDSANFTPTAEKTLNEVIKFLTLYRIDVAEVFGYGSSQGSQQRQRVLTDKQAQKVVEYLWNKGIDVRLLTAEGYGTKYPVASNNSDLGKLTNQRIVIRFRYISDKTTA